MGMEMSDLPKGWTECSIGEFVISKKGKKPKSTIKEYQKGYLPYILIDELEGNPPRLYTNDTFIRLISKNDVLLVWDGSIGKCGSGIEGVIGSTLVGLIPLGGVLTKFLEYTIKLVNNFIKETSTGTGLQHINKDFLNICKVLLPPLNEQKRIVAKLDKLLGKVDTAKARLDKIPQTLKRFRQSVLSAAVSGELTKDWRIHNLSQESSEILLKTIKDSIGKSKFSSREKDKFIKFSEKKTIDLEETDENMNIPSTWTLCKIGNIGIVCNGSTPSRKRSDFWKGRIPWVSSGEVKNDIIFLTKEKISKLGYDNSSVKLLPKGTVLLAMIGEGKTRGQSAILSIESTINQNVAAIIINHGYVVSRYLFIWFQFRYEKTRNVGSGSGPQALNCERVRELIFHLPPFGEQEEIVRRVEQLFKFADQIEARYNKAKQHVDKLTQSILAKAFRGELVPQDPNDEPAEKLLERIKEQKSMEGVKNVNKSAKRRNIKKPGK